MTSESDARHLAPLEHERLVLGATSAAVLRIDGQKAHWVAWTAASGGDAPTVPLSLGDPSPIADVVTEHRGQLFARVADEREAYPGWSAAGVDGPSAYVPIVVAGAVVGVLTASYPVAHVLRAHDVELLNSLAHRWGDRLVGVPGAPQNQAVPSGAEPLQPMVGVAFEGLVVPSAISDPAGRYVAVNAALRQLFGRTPEEMIGHSFAEFTDPGSAEADRDATARVAGGENEVSFRKHFRHANGNRLEVDVTLVPLRDAAGSWFGTLAQYQPVDVSRRMYESAAQRVFAALPVAVAVFDLEQRYIAVNPAMADLNGRPISEHIGKTVAEVLLQPSADEVSQVLDEVAKTGEPVLERPGEVRPRAGGRVQHVLASWFPLMSDAGRVFATASVVLDITDRVRAEEGERRRRHTLESLVGALPIPVALLDDTGRYSMVNAAIASLMGVQPREHIGRTVSDLYPPMVVDAIERITSSTRGAPRQLTMTTRRTSGERVDLRLTGFEVPDEGWGFAVIDDSEVHAARRRVQVLSEIATRLSSSVSVTEMVQVAEEAFVSELSTMSATAVAIEGRECVLLLGSTLPERVADAYARFPVTDDLPVTAAIRTGQPIWIDTHDELVTAFPLIASEADDRHVHAIGVVPLRSGRDVIGAVALAWDHDRHPTSAERRWTDGVCSILAQSLVRAWRTEHDRHVADVLQQSLLPHALDAPEWLAVAAAYRAAGAGTVGGDTYDLIRRSDGSVAIVIADVCGRGVDIAADAASIRHTLRAELLSGRDPCTALRTADVALASLDPNELTLATAAVATIAPPDASGTCQATLTLAGQPPAVLRHR
ncbi:MAG TPA: PAS domain-containing protein, partial [Ilumatobacteraceae bacterium]|nr:PAS domain-containing protein [Ilumatobacteraceae bacterium]